MSISSEASPDSAGLGSAGNDDELLRLIYDGILDPQPLLGSVEHLRRRLRCSHGNIAFYYKDVPVLRMDATEPGEVGISTLRDRFQCENGPMHPISNDRLEAGYLYTTDEISRRATHTERSQRFLRESGIGEILMLMVDEPGGARCGLTFTRRSPASAFSEAEGRLLLSTYPHYRSALRILTRLNHTGVECEIYRSVLGSTSIGTIVLDSRQQVVSVDPVAEGVLARNPRLQLRERCLRVTDRKLDTQLRALLQQAVEAGGVEHQAPFSRSLGLDDYGHLNMLVRSLKATSASANDQFPAAVIYVSDTHSTGKQSAQRFSEVFRLSPSEAALASRLVDGHTLSEAAVELGLSEQTARTYSKHIFAKTGTRRQAELVRVLLNSVARLEA